MNKMTKKRPSFMAMLNAFFLPFVYFFSRKRTLAGIVSLIVCFISIPLMFFVVGFLTYLLMSSWAIWGLQNEVREAHISEQAYAIAQAMKEDKET